MYMSTLSSDSTVDINLWTIIVNDSDSFQHLDDWIDEVKKNQVDDLCQLVIVGNKIDFGSKRIISTEQGLQLAQIHGADYCETR